MKDFSRHGGRLGALPFAARAVYSIFALFTLAGLAFSMALTHDMVGLDLSGVDTYYGGEPALVDDTADADGPEIVLPPEANGVGASEAMPRRKLLEVTHFHLFSMPVYLLILSHLFMLGTSRDVTKVVIIAIGTLGTVLHIVAPWIATRPSSFATAAYAISGLMLVVAYTIMCVHPLWDMWGRAK